MGDNDSMMNKVRALLDKAESTEFAAEAEAYRAKAEELMAKYRLDIEKVLASKVLGEGVDAPEPIHFDTDICRTGQFSKYYSYMWGLVVAHVGIRSYTSWKYPQGEAVWTGQGVGFEADVQYAQMLFTTARMAFSDRLEPKVNPEASDQENVYRLRSAGIERIRIADIMWGQTDKVFLGRVGRLYKAECANRGEAPALSGRGVTGAAYREAYAEEFVYELARRLRAARSGGSGLALGNRELVLSAAFYARFPELRPKAEVEGTEEYKPCEKCAKAKRGYCKEHSNGGHRVPKGRDPFSAAALRGRASGGAAARTVDITVTGRKTGIGGVS